MKFSWLDDLDGYEPRVADQGNCKCGYAMGALNAIDMNMRLNHKKIVDQQNQKLKKN